MTKELYIQVTDEIEAELTESGMPEEKARQIAESKAYDRMRDRMADMADDLRARRLEQMP